MKFFESVFLRFFLVGLITLGFMYYAYRVVNNSVKTPDMLAIYGPLNPDSSDHTIAPFSFVDQTGKKISQSDFDGKIYVADFFFTTCKGICPIMSGQMERVYKEFKGSPEILFLSHSVKPDEDTVSVLSEYAKMHDADPSQWHFVTGNKKEIYDLARHSYIVSISEGNGGPDDFVHTQFFTLIDPKRRIRGFYDGTDSVQVDKLIGDIRILMEEGL